METKIQLAGSYKPLRHNETLLDTVKNETISVTIRLRRIKELAPGSLNGEHLTHEAYEKIYGASTGDVESLKSFADEYRLTITETDLARRMLKMSGTIGDLEKAFNVSLKEYKNSLGRYRVLSGEIHLPASLKDIIKGVFGLDNRPIARAMVQAATADDGTPLAHAAVPQAFTADQLARIYGFPATATGKGQCIAIIELAGGYRDTDMSAYFAGLNIPKPVIKAVLVDTGSNSPTVASSWDTEVVLDIQVAGAVAPGATIVVYFTSNNDQGFLDAITKAIHDKQNKPSVISISWGSAEVNWTSQAIDNFNEAFKTAAALGVTVCVGSGDSGSRDGETDGKVHVDHPASSPYVLACGGTSLLVNNSQVVSETVWKDSVDAASGGGVSNYFPLPAYQQNANVPLNVDTNFKGRGVPDVAANADKNTGYKVLVDGQQMVLGGTSAAAPLMAGLIALANEKNGKPAGFINPRLYKDPGMCRNITQGDNKTTSNNTGYTANPGWDGCTGLGVLWDL